MFDGSDINGLETNTILVCVIHQCDINSEKLFTPHRRYYNHITSVNKLPRISDYFVIGRCNMVSANGISSITLTTRGLLNRRRACPAIIFTLHEQPPVRGLNSRVCECSIYVIGVDRILLNRFRFKFLFFSSLPKHFASLTDVYMTTVPLMVLFRNTSQF